MKKNAQLIVLLVGIGLVLLLGSCRSARCNCPMSDNEDRQEQPFRPVLPDEHLV